MHVTPAKSNVFAELGSIDAEKLRLRANLMIEIRRYIKTNELTQSEAGRLMGTIQHQINDILKGRMEKCTIDRLVNLQAKVGRHVTLQIDEAV